MKLERGDVPAGEMLEVCLERATATARRKHIHLDRRLEPDAMIRSGSASTFLEGRKHLI